MRGLWGENKARARERKVYIAHVDLSCGYCSLGLNCGLQGFHSSLKVSLQMIQMLGTHENIALRLFCSIIHQYLRICRDLNELLHFEIR